MAGNVRMLSRISGLSDVGIAVLTWEMLMKECKKRMQNGSKLMSKDVGRKRGLKVGIYYQELSLASGQYVSDFRITPDYRCLYFNI